MGDVALHLLAYDLAPTALLADRPEALVRGNMHHPARELMWGAPGTMIAALVTTRLPAGTWSHSLVSSYFHGERITYAIVAVVVGIVAAAGAATLTDSHSAEEAH